MSAITNTGTDTPAKNIDVKMKRHIPFGSERRLAELLDGNLYQTITISQIQLKDFRMPGDMPAAIYFFNLLPGGNWEAKANPYGNPVRIHDMEQLMETAINNL